MFRFGGSEHFCERGVYTNWSHSIFYYPYASLQSKQSMLLKALALYFDKLYVLDPAKASWATIGAGQIERDLRLLEVEGLLQRVAPEEVLLHNEKTIFDAIRSDLADPGFQNLCAGHGQGRWTLALAKVPATIRNDPAFQPLDQAMKQLMTDFKSGSEVYDEWRESQNGNVEYRYADYPFSIGEAIMLNHALVSSLLHTNAVPLTDDVLHSNILNYKLQKASQLPALRDVLESREKQQQFASTSAVAQALTDLQLGAIPEALTLEQILNYRRNHGAELQSAREALDWMAREIVQRPWTKDFEDEVYHQLIPNLHTALQPTKSSWSSWLKAAGLTLSGAAVVLAWLWPFPSLRSGLSHR